MIVVDKWGDRDLEVDLSVDEAKDALTNPETRIGKAWHGNVLEIKYQDKWLQLARTDLKDDVATNLVGPSDEELLNGTVLEFYKRRIVYGARLTDKAFNVVDSFSDG